MSAALYEDPSLATGEMRVLPLLPGDWSAGIQCALNVAALDGNPEYEAISYVWGHPNGHPNLHQWHFVLHHTESISRTSSLEKEGHASSNKGRCYMHQPREYRGENPTSKYYGKDLWENPRSSDIVGRCTIFYRFSFSSLGWRWERQVASGRILRTEITNCGRSNPAPLCADVCSCYSFPTTNGGWHTPLFSSPWNFGMLKDGCPRLGIIRDSQDWLMVIVCCMMASGKG